MERRLVFGVDKSELSEALRAWRVAATVGARVDAAAALKALEADIRTRQEIGDEWALDREIVSFVRIKTAIQKWVIVTATGEFIEGGFRDPVPPDDIHSVVVVPGAVYPDARTQKWDGAAIVAKTQAEIDAYDATQPKLIRTRDLLRRITNAEQDAIDELAKTTKPLKRLMHLMLSDGYTDVNHADFVQGWAYIKSIGIPAIWPDAAAADAAIARIRA